MTLYAQTFIKKSFMTLYAQAFIKKSFMTLYAQTFIKKKPKPILPNHNQYSVKQTYLTQELLLNEVIALEAI